MEVRIRNKWTPDEITTVTLMAKQGASTDQIAQIVNHTAKSVETKRRELGVSGKQLKSTKPDEPEQIRFKADDKKDMKLDNLQKRIQADELALNELIRDVRELRERLYDIELFLQQSPIYRATHKFNKEV